MARRFRAFLQRVCEGPYVYVGIARADEKVVRDVGDRTQIDQEKVFALPGLKAFDAEIQDFAFLIGQGGSVPWWG